MSDRQFHPFSKPAGMKEKILLPSDTRKGCSNDTLVQPSGTDEVGRFVKRLNLPCNPKNLSPKNQLVALVHAFYSDVRVRACPSRQCENIKGECRKMLPACRQGAFRECIVTLVSCHFRALRDLYIQQVSLDGSTVMALWPRQIIFFY